MSVSGNIEKAIGILKKKQQDYYIQWVKDAIETENQRKVKLEKAGSRDECKRLEKQFEKERAKEKERLQQIQEDHQLILKAKISEWKVRGVPESALTSVAEQHTQEGPASKSAMPLDHVEDPGKQKAATRKMSKAALERLSSRPPTFSSDSDTSKSQQLAFQKDVIRKQDLMRLHRGQSLPSLNAENLNKLSQTDLLQRKMNLLTQLHGVVSMQERIIQYDQCTVRSAVSSWKSGDFQSVRGVCR